MISVQSCRIVTGGSRDRREYHVTAELAELSETGRYYSIRRFDQHDTNNILLCNQLGRQHWPLYDRGC